MDQGAVVGEQISDGRRFVERFAADGNPVQAAFWVKTAEYGVWHLYVVTDLYDRVGPAAAYRAVHATLQKLPESGISSSEIKVISPNNPIAKEVLAVMAHHPGWSASRFVGKTLGSVEIEQAHIYPQHFFTFTQVSPMTTEDIGRELVRLMNRGPGTVHPSRVTLKDGTAFNGVPFALEVGMPGTMTARFIAEGEAAPRVVRLDEIGAIG